MDRTLVVEFPWLALTAEENNWSQTVTTDTRSIGLNGFVQEMKLDLSGYTQSDLTIGFRRSFEQISGAEQIFWETFDVKTDYTIETIIISSVPFNDNQLAAALVSSPGFTQYSGAGAVDWGNFNRTHIIHGHYMAHMPNTTIGSSSFTSKGNATLLKVTDNYFSSLEPTASDCLYCYRIFAVPGAGSEEEGISALSLPARRVILDSFTVEEPQLEYMMRLKRSYELANQV